MHPVDGVVHVSHVELEVTLDCAELLVLHFVLLVQDLHLLVKRLVVAVEELDLLVEQLDEVVAGGAIITLELTRCDLP